MTRGRRIDLYDLTKPERLRLDWVSASEGERFTRIAREFTEKVRALGPTRWRRITEAVHAAGGRIFLQLWHVGRISHPSLQLDGAQPVAPSAICPRARP